MTGVQTCALPIFTQDFEIDHVQPILFVLDSFDQLFEATQEAKRRLNL